VTVASGQGPPKRPGADQAEDEQDEEDDKEDVEQDAGHIRAGGGDIGKAE
jgi:hypothetical protein